MASERPLAYQVIRAIQAEVPEAVSISIGNDANKATWLVTFTPGTPGPQRIRAQQIIDAFDPAVAHMSDMDEHAQQISREALTMFYWLWRNLKGTEPTPTEVNTALNTLAQAVRDSHTRLP